MGPGLPQTTAWGAEGDNLGGAGVVWVRGLAQRDNCLHKMGFEAKIYLLAKEHFDRSNNLE